MAKYTISYSSNNSGGYWWLKDDDWLKLHKAGWNVKWAKDENRVFTNGDRYLGALATRAEKEFNTVKDAIIEFENITGQVLSDEGCNCCGAPHSFTVTNNKTKKESYFSGMDFIDLIDLSKDEIIERLKRR